MKRVLLLTIFMIAFMIVLSAKNNTPDLFGKQFVKNIQKFDSTTFYKKFYLSESKFIKWHQSVKEDSFLIKYYKIGANADELYGHMHKMLESSFAKSYNIIKNWKKESAINTQDIKYISSGYSQIGTQKTPNFMLNYQVIIKSHTDYYKFQIEGVSKIGSTYNIITVKSIEKLEYLFPKQPQKQAVVSQNCLELFNAIQNLDSLKFHQQFILSFEESDLYLYPKYNDDETITDERFTEINDLYKQKRKELSPYIRRNVVEAYQTLDDFFAENNLSPEDLELIDYTFDLHFLANDPVPNYKYITLITTCNHKRIRINVNGLVLNNKLKDIKDLEIEFLN